MAQPVQQRRRLAAVLLLAALLLLSLCLLARARVDDDAAAVATAVSAGANLESKEGVMATSSLDEAVGQEATTAAAATGEEGDRPERMEMESINDYVPFGANNRHNPHP